MKYFTPKLKVAISAARLSTTMDFSWVTAKAGLLQITVQPLACKRDFISSLARLPEERAGFSMIRTLTPRAWAAISAWAMSSEVKVNIFRQTVFAAPLIQVQHRLAPLLGFDDGAGCLDQGNVVSKFHAVCRRPP